LPPIGAKLGVFVKPAKFCMMNACALAGETTHDT
jgi:hypothetical protein